MQVIQDTLTNFSVSIQSVECGTRAYINSARGRAWLAAECPPDIVQQVLAVWGDTPSVDEPVIDCPEPITTMPSTQDIVNANIMARLAALEGDNNV